MKQINFYYRSKDTIQKHLNIENKPLSIKEMALVNFFILKSKRYIDLVDKDQVCQSQEIKHFLENENVSSKLIFKTLMKIVVHRLFRFFWKFNFLKKDGENLIKTYVDVELDLFKDKLINTKSNSFIIVLPFPLNVYRQLKFIYRLCFKEKIGFSLYGLDYSFTDFWNLLINKKAIDLFHLEFNANLRVSNDFENFYFSNLLTMDDYDPMNLVFSESLTSNKIIKKCIMHLHGIGTYSLFIYADELKAFNSKQIDYYNFHKIIPSNITYNFEKKDCQKNKKYDLLFFSQVTNEVKALEKIEKRILAKLSLICAKNGRKLYYKRHPNSKRRYYFNKMNIHDFNKDMASGNMIGLSLYSTSFYTDECAQSYVIRTEDIPAYLLFEEEAFLAEEKLHEIF